MKVKPAPLGRREFITATTVGIALSSFRPTARAAAAAQASGTGIKPTGISRLLYVTNDENERIDVYDTDAGHALVRSIPWVGTWAKTSEGKNDNKATGVTSHPATNRLFMTNKYSHLVSAYDAVTGKLAWQVDTVKQFGLGEPDRLAITADGSALYVPMGAVVGQKGEYSYQDWKKHVNLVLDPANGARIATVPRPGRPHSNWAGEGGQYMYLGAWADTNLVVADQKTHKVAKTIGPFNWPIRLAVTNPDERYVYLALSRTIGLAVGDVRAGRVLPEIPVEVPKERMKDWWAAGGMPHLDTPWSDGLGIRPGGSGDIYLMDDEWGYLYVLDTKANPASPKLKGNVPLFSDMGEPWGKRGGRRFVAFSIDGKYCYPSDGSVVDCDTGKVTTMKIAPSETLLQVEFRDGKAVRTSGQQGGVYGQRA